MNASRILSHRELLRLAGNWASLQRELKAVAKREQQEAIAMAEREAAAKSERKQ